MRTYLIALTAFIFMYFPASSQDLRPGDVPEAVRAEFTKKYPNMYVYEWEWKRKKGLYKAEFAINGFEHEAYFKPNGEWAYTEKEISYLQLPEKVIHSIRNSEYSNWKLDDIEEYNTPEHPVVYKVELEKGKAEVDLYFLPDGTQITITNF